MPTFARRLHGKPQAHAAQPPKGLILSGGWHYDLMEAGMDVCFFRGQLQQMRQRTLTLAQLQADDGVLDVGCGTGTMTLHIPGMVGTTGRVVGIDPSAEQIARARSKAARRHTSIDFQIGVIEALPFPDGAFTVVFSTLMMHHLGKRLQQQGLAEIQRVLSPGGRLIIADFMPKPTRKGAATRFHAGGSALEELVALVQEAGWSQVTTATMAPLPWSAFPGVGWVVARNR